MVMSLIAAAAVLAAPTQASGTEPHWPRLTQFPDAAVMTRVNAAIAAKEKQNSADYKQCLSDLHDAGEKPDDETWSLSVRIGYLTERYFSLEVTSSSYCGGAYPNNGIETPVTFDLKTGREIDWKTVFKPGFAPDALTKLYRSVYPRDAGPDCRKLVMSEEPFESADGAIFRLQAGRGLMVLPDFAHATQACAEEVALPAAKLAPYLADPALLSELRAIGTRRE
jgi:hypothetical protein